MTNIICGIDVSSTTLDARISHDGPWQHFEATDIGIDQLLAFCQLHGATLAVMEATGGYERHSFARLWAAGLPVAIANPRAVRRFAEAMGLLEKTDRIDAGIIAWFAEAKRLKPTQPSSASQQRLQALVTRLRQLTEARVVQLNQRRLITDTTVLATFNVLLAAINSQTRIIEADISKLISDDAMWTALDTAFRTIKGVADRTVARLMAELPEIGTLSNKAIAKLAGLAPIANDSGKHHGKRPVRAGREGIRSILVIVAEVVRRHDPDFADFHRRLNAAGKPKMVTRIALAHKLLVRLNAKARDARIEMAKTA